MGHNWVTYTYGYKIVADYCNIPITEVDELLYIDYLIYRRDAIIHRLSMTEEGQEYLRNAWRIQEVAPDRDSLRAKMSN